MVMANGRMMEFALLAGDRYGYPENHIDKWETKSSSTTAAQRWIWRYEMGKHAIGGMRSMMVANRKADMRFRKKANLRNKNAAERGNRNDHRRSNPSNTAQ